MLFALFALLWLQLLLCTGAISVDYDSRAFLVDGKRQLFVAGSIHYPRASSSEWPHILAEAKANGINLIQTYVFWSIHEPNEPGVYYFPNDGSRDDLVEFIRECDRQGLYVNLRFGPYTCAEWNFGGFPMWLKALPNITFRTMDDQWLNAMQSFIQATVDVVDAAKLFAKDGGPIIMAQIENEYGNMEDSYGEDGARYVQWSAAVADAFNLQIPWIMCQQGEGVGTAPPAHIINTCNGYYCDNWIEKHVADFPNQPHMFTENWPGWFQNWGQPVPHRPAVDVAFSVARWYAKGGTYMNYYMAFGGTTFGRQVGGPLIITSYDYDVQINEFGMRAEPKFSLTARLHEVLMGAADVLLAPESLPLPVAVPLANASNCETHTYASGGVCYQFLSNFDTSADCDFPGDVSVLYHVPSWSVSILKGEVSSSAACVSTQELLNTKASVYDASSSIAPANHQVGLPVDTAFSLRSVGSEPTPFESSADARVRVVSAVPMEQLSLTNDTTDYLWYSVNMTVRAGATEGTLTFKTGAAGGATVFAYVNGVLSGSTLGPNGEPVLVKKGSDVPILDITHSVSVSIPASCRAGDQCQLDLLSMNMGVQNYGPFLEGVQTGIISELRWRDGARASVLSPVTHTVGLMGEQDGLAPTPAALDSVNEPLRWYTLAFSTPAADESSMPMPLALDLAGTVAGSHAMTKGAVWVNGHMLGRYWDAAAENQDRTQACDETCLVNQMDWVGKYEPVRCVTGCGVPSQSLYKVPYEWLKADGSANELVLFEEVGGDPSNVRMAKVVMENY